MAIFYREIWTVRHPAPYYMSHTNAKIEKIYTIPQILLDRVVSREPQYYPVARGPKNVFQLLKLLFV